MPKIILASKSEIRKKILEDNNIDCEMIPSNLDEEPIKIHLMNDGASPELISKNLAELKANKVSLSQRDKLVLGADSVINLDENIISKPKDRKEAFEILVKLNGKKHELISSVCISRNGNMIWNYSDKAILEMKNFKNEYLKNYLSKITDKSLYSYNVYQIEGEGKKLFNSIEGDLTTVMGLPIVKIKNYLENLL
tara:strand:- start:1226 stop:1810 length:585 start_codon:yes stop_codon:yes gene_type:complete